MNGAFKGLNQSDVYLTSYISKKLWEAIGSASLENLGISKVEATSGSSTYASYRVSYYEGSIPDSGSFSGSYDLDLQSTITLQGGRRLPETMVAYKIPRDCFGETIEPGSFELEDETCYIKDQEGLLLLDTAERVIVRELTLEEAYLEDETEVAKVTAEFPVITGQVYSLFITIPPDCDWTGLETVECLTLEGADTGELDPITGETLQSYRDQGDKLEITFVAEQPRVTFTYIAAVTSIGVEIQPDFHKLEGSKSVVVGDIIYNKGLILLHGDMVNPGNCDLYWTSNVTINTWNVKCKVKDLECNYSYNPSIKGGNLDIMGTPEFTPYVTTVGLYNRAGELMATAKLSKPIKKNDNIDMTFKVNIDIS